MFDALLNRAVSVSGDQTVAVHHAIIRREGSNSSVSEAGGGQVLINRRTAAGRQVVRSGNRSRSVRPYLFFASAPPRRT